MWLSDISVKRPVFATVISLLLVAGSHFRCRDKARKGLDENGKPIDARILFDEQLLKRMAQTVFAKYYHGFTGSPPSTDSTSAHVSRVRRDAEERTT